MVGIICLFTISLLFSFSSVSVLLDSALIHAFVYSRPIQQLLYIRKIKVFESGPFLSTAMRVFVSVRS